MRGAWLLAVLGGLTAAASCILPAASVRATGGAGGSGAGAGPASSGTGPGMGPPPPEPATAVIVVFPMVPVKAPTGNPGQRHIINVEGTWYAFYVDRDSMTGKTQIMYRGANETTKWGPTALAAQYDLGTVNGTSSSLDGRSFGVDTRKVGTIDAVHVSLSSADPMALSHVRGYLGGTGPAFEAPLSTTKTPAFGGDGTVTMVGADTPSTVADFTSVPGAGVSVALVASMPETGTQAMWNAQFTAQPIDTSDVSAMVRMRSTAALAGGGIAFWRNGSDLELATQAPPDGGTPWAPRPLTNMNDAGIGNEERSFATCTASSDLARVLYWDGFRLRFLGLDHLGSPTQAADLSTPGNEKPEELVLVCGTHRAHAFAIFADEPNVIRGASWDVNLGWSPWVSAVDTSSLMPEATRCFLTGFDRAAPGDSQIDNTAGLAWTESTDCTKPGPAAIWSAFVRVFDG